MWIKSAISFESGDAIVSALCNRMTEMAGVNVTLYDNGGGPVCERINILQQTPSKLLSVAFVDRLKLLSPRTWWGLMDSEDKKDFSSFAISKTVKSATGLLLPLLVLSCIVMFRRSYSAATTASPRLLIASLILPPLSLQCFYQLYCQLSMLFGSLRRTLKSRSSTLARATDALKLRIRHRRAYRTRGYDVYLPPALSGFSENDTDSSSDTQTLRALLFIPGALVAHEAYSEVASRLSDKGFVVAVMSLEPLRLAERHFGANLASVKRIIHEITGSIHTYVPAEGKFLKGDRPAKTVEWTLMGHSMGSFAAMQLFHEFFDDPNYNNDMKSRAAWHRRNTEKPTSIVDVILGKKLVLWGVAAFVNSATDLSDQRDTEILILQGTNDEWVELMRSRQDELEACFPPSTRTEHISGGTHEGFGSYKPNIPVDDYGGKKTPKRSIPLDQQHKRACDATIRFLQS